MFKFQKTKQHLIQCPCNMQSMSLKEVYQKMLEDITTHYETLSTANSAKLIQDILQNISLYQVDCRVPENIRHMVTDIQEKANAMQMSDYTRLNMCKDLEALYFALRNALYGEEYKEVQEQRDRFILKVIADHPEEFQKWFSQFTHEYTNPPTGAR